MHFLETAIAIVYVIHELKAWKRAVPNGNSRPVEGGGVVSPTMVKARIEPDCG